MKIIIMMVKSEPVSYTHLRAHETVLDLVCRLLLEKKKTEYTATHTFLQLQSIQAKQYRETICTYNDANNNKYGN